MLYNKSKRIKRTFKQFIERLKLFDQTQVANFIEQQPRPKKILWRRVPDNLNRATMGEFNSLSMVKNEMDMLADTTIELLHIPRWQQPIWRFLVVRIDYKKACGWINFITNEAKRINKLWESIKVEPEDDDVKAGVRQLNFGLFGMIDAYARRMGITNHDDVLKVGWITIWQCSKIDNEMIKFERRRRKVQQDKYKKK